MGNAMFGFKSKKRKAEEAAVQEAFERMSKKIDEAVEAKRNRAKEKALSGAELQKVRDNFQPLVLCNGDKVRWRSEEYRNSNVGLDADLEVFSTLCASKEIDDNGEVRRNDFTVMVMQGGHLHEVAMDSRRFIKVVDEAKGE